jgi:uncharacterized protein YjbI with pentapeptide repeats
MGTFKRTAIAAVASLAVCAVLGALLMSPADAQRRRGAARQTQQHEPPPPPASGTTREFAPGHPTVSCPFCDLSNAQLANQNLVDANLQHADLTGADLSGADLSGAMLDGAIFKNANLSNAKFNTSRRGRADLTGADLTGANLRGASLVGANLQHVDLSAIEQSGVDLSKALMVPPGALSAGENVTCGKADLSNLQTRIYVSQAGSDGPGCGSTVANACASIATGLSRCSGAPACGVLVLYGKYTASATIALTDGVNLYGGCLPTPAANAAIQSLVTAPANGQPAMSASGINKGVLLQGFRLEGTTGAAGAASTTLLVNNSSKLRVIDSEILAGTGGAGGAGGPGSPGTNGAAASGATAGKTSQCSNSAGGNGSVTNDVSVSVSVFSFKCNPSCSANGCWGYRATMGAAGGQWGNGNCAECPRSRGDTGKVGANGGDAGCGGKGVVSSDTAGNFAGATWQGSRGGTGGGGATGGGGGGGGGGGYRAGACFWVKTEDRGNQGGGGGAGGCGGAGGVGGQQGGASFGITIISSQMTLATSTVVGGRGGIGGDGGKGGSAGSRGSGADGLTNNAGGFGGRGGNGGAGGAAGGGAGGNGGPAIGVALLSNSTIADTGAVYYSGASGFPGGFGPGGTPVVSGLCTAPNGDVGANGTVADKRNY